MSDHDPNSVAGRVAAALRASGKGQMAVAVEAGLGPTAVRDILKGRASNPKATTLRALARVLGVSVEYLMGVPHSSPLAPEPFPRTNALPAPDLPPLDELQSRVGANDVPIYGTAQAGDDGWFELNMEQGPLDFAPRPPGVKHDKSVFVVRVDGDSMWPWRAPGQAVYAVKRPLTSGCHVLVMAEKGKGHNPRALIKRYISQDNDWLHLRQYNPPDSAPITVDRNVIWDVFRVLEWEELMGL
jgi:phage repressor protein C with HTH and peptisase S24 domain